MAGMSTKNRIFVIYEGKKTEPMYFQKFSDLLENTDKTFEEIQKNEISCMDANCTIRRDLIDLAYSYKMAIISKEMTVFYYVTKTLDCILKHMNDSSRDDVQGYSDVWGGYVEELRRNNDANTEVNRKTKGNKKILDVCKKQDKLRAINAKICMIEECDYNNPKRNSLLKDKVKLLIGRNRILNDILCDELQEVRRSIIDEISEEYSDCSRLCVSQLQDSGILDAIKRKCKEFAVNKMKICGKVDYSIDNKPNIGKILFPNEKPRFAVVVDRDKDSKNKCPGKLWYEDRTDDQYKSHIKYAHDLGVDFVITTPMFEFWLLLHYDKVKPPRNYERYTADLSKKNTLCEDLKVLDFSVMSPDNYQSEIDEEFNKNPNGWDAHEKARDKVMKRNVDRRFEPCYRYRIMDAIGAADKFEQKPEGLIDKKGTYLAHWITDVLGPYDLHDLFDSDNNKRLKKE